MAEAARGPVDVHATRHRSRLGTVMVAGGRTIISLFSVAVLVLTFYGWHFVGDANSGVTTTKVFDTGPKTEPLDGAVDILLVGMDSRTDAKGNPLPPEVLNKLNAGEVEGNKQTDTMILVHIPQDGGSATAISFPRDAWVELAGGYGENRLNSAFRYAYKDKKTELLAEGGESAAVETKAKATGRKNLIATIEKLIGRPGMIDRYAEVNLASFYEVTNALGGIEVCLKEPVNEPLSGVNLPAGVQTLEGAQALAFVRQRHQLKLGDIDRIARQQAFLSGLARRVLSSEVLLDPSRLGDVIDAVQKSVVLSEDWDLLRFANQMRGLSGGNIEFHTMPWTGFITVGGAEVIGVDKSEVRAFVDGLVGDSRPQDETKPPPKTVPDAGKYTIDLYNASGDPELGKHARELLRKQGFGGKSYATSDPVDSSVIEYAAGARDGAAALRTALGTELPAERDESLPSGTVALRLGSDFTLPPLPGSGANDGGKPSKQAQADDEPKPDSPSGESPRSQGSAGQSQPGTQKQEDAPITADGIPCVY